MLLAGGVPLRPSGVAVSKWCVGVLCLCGAGDCFSGGVLVGFRCCVPAANRRQCPGGGVLVVVSSSGQPVSRWCRCYLLKVTWLWFAANGSLVVASHPVLVVPRRYV